MKYVRMINLSLLLVALSFASCDRQSNQPANAKKSTNSNHSHDHGHEHDGVHSHGTGPNGGVIFDLGKYHAEFTVDHQKQECTILFVSGDGHDAKPLAVAAKELTLTTKETKTKGGTVVPSFTVKLLPADEQDGKASKFVGTDPGIGNVTDFEGIVLGEIDGKPSQGNFKE